MLEAMVSTRSIKFSVEINILCSCCYYPVRRPEVQERNGKTITYLLVEILNKDDLAFQQREFPEYRSKCHPIHPSMIWTDPLQIIPHSAAQNCKGYVSRLQSYCDTGDPFCDGGQDMSAHGGVVRKHLDEAKVFIVNKIKTLSIPVRPDS
jgi:cutinase